MPVCSRALGGLHGQAYLQCVRTDLFKGLGGLHGQGVCPALLPGAGGYLDDVWGVHADVQAQHQGDRRRLQPLLLPPLGQVTLGWPTRALPQAPVLVARIVMQLRTAQPTNLDHPVENVHIGKGPG